MAQTCLGAHTCHMAPVGPICAVQGEHSQDLGWNVTKGVIKEDSMREGLHVTYQFRGQDFFRSPEEAGSSAQNPSKAGGTEGVLDPGLPSALTSAASSSSNHPPHSARQPTSCAASAHALCRHQHIHGTASHQGHQALPSLMCSLPPLLGRKHCSQ